ncbi:hypothetical protein Tsubulata_029342 [Turnera subulata]|uniref:G protein gamma domain-containing protein n=1 Tax=Turnera subulata TaxID=218843 RepID=A0A9Q0JLA8_9ROSI|nr:hypothetical protein Tsubulata_044132 [Turnera subulata]KAJ4845849.1 hypothetical protein Tsubulata_029342 [Turnera subulata]
MDHHQESAGGGGGESRRDREEQRVASTTLVLNNTAEPLMGKHRMAAAIALLQNQINFIQEELDQLDSLGESSLVCKELLSSVGSIPDPLLPTTKGPADVGWDRWFRGTHNNSRRRWL